MAPAASFTRPSCQWEFPYMDPTPVQRGLERDDVIPVASVISGLCKWGVVIARAPDGFPRVFIASTFFGRPQGISIFNSDSQSHRTGGVANSSPALAVTRNCWSCHFVCDNVLCHTLPVDRDCRCLVDWHTGPAVRDQDARLKD
jgi:hypothetical protein